MAATAPTLSSTATAVDALAGAFDGPLPMSVVRPARQTTPQRRDAEQESLSASPADYLASAQSDALAMTIRPRDDAEADPITAARVLARRLGAGLIKRPVFSAGGRDASDESAMLLLANGSAAAHKGSFATLDVSLRATRQWRSSVSAPAAGAAGGGEAADKRGTLTTMGDRINRPHAASLHLPPPPQPQHHAGYQSDRCGGRRAVKVLSDPSQRSTLPFEESLPGQPPLAGSQRSSALDINASARDGRRSLADGGLSARGASRPTASSLMEREYTEAELEENAELRQLTNVWRKLQLANAIVAEANDIAPPRPIRTEAERQAELLRLERAKLLLLVGRKYNLEQTLEELLEVLAAREKADERRRRKPNQGTLPRGEDTAAETSSGAASSDVTTPSGEGATPLLSPSHPDKGGGGVRRHITASHQMKALRQLNATLLSRGSATGEELSVRALQRAVGDVGELLADTQAQVSRELVSASRKQHAEALAALSNYKDIMWLIEGVDLALISDLDSTQHRTSLPGGGGENGAEAGITLPATTTTTISATPLDNTTDARRAVAKPGKDTVDARVAFSTNQHDRTDTADVEAAAPSLAVPIASNGAHRASQSLVSSSTLRTSAGEPSVVPFSLLSDRAQQSTGDDNSIPERSMTVAAAAAQVKRATDGLVMLGFMLEAIPDTSVGVVERSALNAASRPPTATGPSAASRERQRPPQPQPQPAKDNASGTRARDGDDIAEADAITAGVETGRGEREASHASLPAVTVFARGEEGRRDSYSVSEHEGEADGSDDESFQHSDDADGSPVCASRPATTTAGSAQEGISSSGAPMKFFPIRADLLADLKKLYPQFDYDHFIEARRAGRGLSVTQRPEKEYVAEMQDALRRRREENLSREAANAQTDEELALQAMLGAAGKPASQSGGSRVASAASRSVTSAGPRPVSPSQGSKRASASAIRSEDSAARPLSSRERDADGSRVSGTGRPPVTPATTSSSAAAAMAQGGLSDNALGTLLYEERLPCGLHFAVYGNAEAAASQSRDGADTNDGANSAAAHAAGKRKRPKKGKEGKPPANTKASAAPNTFERFHVVVRNEHTYSAAAASLRLISSKLPGITSTIELGVEAVRPTELRRTLQPGESQRFVTLVPTLARLRRAGSITFADALVCEGELSNGFDTFTALRPGSGSGGLAAGSGTDDGFDALSIRSDDANRFISSLSATRGAKAADSKSSPLGPLYGPASYAYHAEDTRPTSTASTRKLPPVKPKSATSTSSAPPRAAASAKKKPATPEMTQYVFPPPPQPTSATADTKEQAEMEAVENNLVAISVMQSAAAAAAAAAAAGAADVDVAGARDGDGGATHSRKSTTAVHDGKAEEGTPMAELLAELAPEQLPAAAAELMAQLGSADGISLSRDASAGAAQAVGEADARLGTPSAANESSADASAATITPGRHDDAPGLPSPPQSPSALLPGFASPPTIVIASAHSRPLSKAEASSFSSPGGIQFDVEVLQAAAAEGEHGGEGSRRSSGVAEVAAAASANADENALACSSLIDSAAAAAARRESVRSGRSTPSPPVADAPAGKAAAVLQALQRSRTTTAAAAAAVGRGDVGKAPLARPAGMAGIHLTEETEEAATAHGAATLSALQQKGAATGGKKKRVGVGRGPVGNVGDEQTSPVKLVAEPAPGCYTAVVPGTSRVQVLVPADAAGDEVVQKLFAKENGAGAGTAGSSSAAAAAASATATTATATAQTSKETTRRDRVAREGLLPAQHIAMMVTEVLKGVVGSEAKAARRGMTTSDERGRRGGGRGPTTSHGSVVGGATAKTEMEVLQEEARALYLEDPLRYDAVVDDLVKLATTQLSGGDVGAGGREGGGNAFSGLVETEALAAIVQAAADMERQLLGHVGGGSGDQRDAGSRVAVRKQMDRDPAALGGGKGYSSAIPRPQQPPQPGEDGMGDAHGEPQAVLIAGDSTPADAREEKEDSTVGPPALGLDADRRRRPTSAFSRGGPNNVFPRSDEAATGAGMGHHELQQEAATPRSPPVARHVSETATALRTRVESITRAEGVDEERKRRGLAEVEESAAEVQRILFEQMKAKLLLKLIVEQMRALWARKEVEGREKARAALDRTLANALDLSWRVERERVVHVTKLIHLLDRRTGRVHGWLPFYNDDNVLVDASDVREGGGTLSHRHAHHSLLWRGGGAGTRRVRAGAAAATTALSEEERWCEASASYRNTSGLHAIPTFSSATASFPQRRPVLPHGAAGASGPSSMGCARYTHYHEPGYAQANGDVFLSSLQLRRLYHAMCLAKRRRLLPLRLVRAPAEPDRSNGTRYALFGYRRHVVVLSHLAPRDGAGSGGPLNDFPDGVEVRRKLRETLMPFTKPRAACVTYRQLTPHDSVTKSARQLCSYEARQHALPPISQLLREKGKDQPK